MRYAVQQGLTENNLALYLEGITAPPVKHHHPTLSLEPLLELLERIGDYQLGRQLTRLAMVLTLSVYLFQRVALCPLKRDRLQFAVPSFSITMPDTGIMVSTLNPKVRIKWPIALSLAPKRGTSCAICTAQPPVTKPLLKNSI